MNIVEIIAKKRDHKKLVKEEIEYFIEEYVKGNIADYQAAALIMAIYLNGMDEEETTNLTLAMVKSGDTLKIDVADGNIVDKHSTGGVGDKITLILAPIIASMGVPVAKMSGRGLGFTGGTIDKLKSIPGYETQIGEKDFIDNVKKIGISLISQTLNLVPADKKIYALRDAISCTDSIPLIASSIMSKKIASGADKIVIDVTVGSGAFMKTIEQARKLANLMIQIGKLAGKETICILTKMDEPLGYAIGNNLEVIEAINSLKGYMPEDIEQVVLELGSHMLKLAGKGNDIEKNKQAMIRNITNIKAYEKFVELVRNQGGDASYLKDTGKFKKAEYIIPVPSNATGYIEQLDAKKVGEISCFLGAGRLQKEDIIQESVGVILKKKVADHITKGEVLAYIYGNDEQKAKQAAIELRKAYQIVEYKVDKPSVIIDMIE